ncbi:hypothetical protein [Pararhodobacter zhoushanensis]|uniref:Polysaccharide pyruvyl transferase domain-containing protein n=1 Tax=Pararhodobacter zhoushanensis TaxID=2479545 RepID=A0ABT3H1U3_9RHOB|nr:hypothetical protein [Pararhodobacter zhoushanensis]MCW1933777.1 hypothetical protein [Pararhodobacter zhoushanensis]
MSKRVLVWGFYDQGNLGDDLMALMMAELAKQAGAVPVICSSNRDFADAGYEICATPADSRADLVLLGGGAFFKANTASKSSIEDKICLLATFLHNTSTPVYGLSLGSDGIESIEDASPARQSVVDAPGFSGAAIRLQQDLALGVRDLTFIPDIVLCTAHFCREVMGWKTPGPSTPKLGTLLNFSRRSLPSLLKTLWKKRGKRISMFQAHARKSHSGGEIVFPGLRNFRADDIPASLSAIAASDGIVSSKLHPGIIALSFGVPFEPKGSRPKTIAFFAEFDRQDFQKNAAARQREIWEQYRARLVTVLNGG